MSDKEIFSEKSVILILNSEVIRLSGLWCWNLYSDLVFCSDVMLSAPVDFEGTKGIIHPDDKKALTDQLVSRCLIAELQFRIITTYGEVITLTGRQITPENEANGIQMLHSCALHQKDESSLWAHLNTITTGYIQAEKYAGCGIWYYNTATNAMWYSNQVYKIFDLPPTSLNHHLNTFDSFIHPDDFEIVKNYSERAYHFQIPLHMEFRIITSSGEKLIMQITQWQFSPQGEMVQFGIVQDITGWKWNEQQKVKAYVESVFNEQLLQLQEQHGNLGYWHVNLLTRKTYYSDNLYRLFGLKPQSLPAGIGTFNHFVHQGDTDAFEKVLLQMMQKEVAPHFNFRIIRSDGKIRHLSQKAKLIEKNGEPVVICTLQDVTDAKMIEQKLSGQAENIALHQMIQQQLTEAAGIHKWIWDLQTGLFTCSEKLLSMLGIRQSALSFTYDNFLEFIYQEDKIGFTEAVDRMLQQKEETEFDFRLVSKGEVRQIKAFFRCAAPTQNAYFIALFLDITPVKLFEKEAKEQQLLVNSLAANIKERIIVTDTDNRVLLWITKCEEDFKIKYAEAIGKNYFDLVAADARNKELDFYNRALQGETIRMNIWGPDLNKRYYNLNITPLFADDEKTVLGVIQLTQDITRQYLLDKNLKNRLSLIESLVESSVDPIIALDQNMNYLVWNRQCEALYGLSKSHVLGKNILEVFPETRNVPAYNDFRKALNGETIFLPPPAEVANEHCFETYLIPVRNEDNEIIAVLWTQHDLTNEIDLNAHKLKINNIIEALNECYYELDADYCFVNINHLAEKFWNVEGSKMIGKAFLDVFPHVEHSPIYKLLVQAMEKRQPSRGDFISPVTGTWVHISFAPTVKGVAVIFYDIQQTKENEIANKDKQYILEQINSITPDALTIYDLEKSEPEYLNNRLAEWTGYTTVELVQMKAAERLQLLHPNDRARLLHFNKEMLNVPNGVVKTLDYRLITKSGTIWICNRCKVFKRNDEGKPTQLLSILQDITQEVQMQKQLEERNQYAQLIFDNSIDQLIIIDTAFNIVAWNKRAEEISGIKRETAIGQNYFKLFPRLAEDDVIFNAFQQAVNGHYMQLPPKKALYNNGIYERFYNPLKNKEGDTWGVLVIIHDITSMVKQSEVLKEFNETLEAKNKELEQKNDEIMQFSFVASHDLKEPLRKLHMYTHWLHQHEKEKLSETGAAYLARMQHSLERIEWLIEDILVLTKIHADTRLQDATNLQELLQQVKSDLKEELKATKAEIFSDTLPLIKGNEKQLFYLFKNLVDNAIKFKQDNLFPEIKITASIIDGLELGKTAEELFLKITFEDNGIGFDSKYKNKIFRIFQRLHTAVNYSGTGIGLAICKKIMDNHNGFITADSQAGKGATFSCYFPASSIITFV